MIFYILRSIKIQELESCDFHIKQNNHTYNAKTTANLALIPLLECPRDWGNAAEYLKKIANLSCINLNHKPRKINQHLPISMLFKLQVTN